MGSVHLRTGQSVSAKIVDIVGPHGLIVSFQGVLVRVENSTGRKFFSGDNIDLLVTGVKPLRFKLSGSERGFARRI